MSYNRQGPVVSKFTMCIISQLLTIYLSIISLYIIHISIYNILYKLQISIYISICISTKCIMSSIIYIPTQIYTNYNQSFQLKYIYSDQLNYYYCIFQHMIFSNQTINNTNFQPLNAYFLNKSDMIINICTSEILKNRGFKYTINS